MVAEKATPSGVLAKMAKMIDAREGTGPVLDLRRAPGPLSRPAPPRPPIPSRAEPVVDLGSADSLTEGEFVSDDGLDVVEDAPDDVAAKIELPSVATVSAGEQPRVAPRDAVIDGDGFGSNAEPVGAGLREVGMLSPPPASPRSAPLRVRDDGVSPLRATPVAPPSPRRVATAGDHARAPAPPRLGLLAAAAILVGVGGWWMLSRSNDAPAVRDAAGVVARADVGIAAADAPSIATQTVAKDGQKKPDSVAAAGPPVQILPPTEAQPKLEPVAAAGQPSEHDNGVVDGLEPTPKPGAPLAADAPRDPAPIAEAAAAKPSARTAVVPEAATPEAATPEGATPEGATPEGATPEAVVPGADEPAAPPKPTTSVAASGTVAESQRAYDEGRFEDARSIADARRRVAPKDNDAIRLQALAACELGDGASARAAFRRLAGPPVRTEVFRHCGRKGVDLRAKGDGPTPGELLAQARRAVAAGDDAKALELARASNRMRRSADALLLMGTTSCRGGDGPAAADLLRHLARDSQRELISACAAAGVRIKDL